jgi:hypothetical protein
VFLRKTGLGLLRFLLKGSQMKTLVNLLIDALEWLDRFKRSVLD